MLIAVDKPIGITSYDVIRCLKKQFPGEKIGHSGTLDPMASGLMLIGIGKDTKKLTQLTGLDKSYITTIDFSKDSDTRDMDYREKYQEFEVLENKSGITKNNKHIPAPNLDDIKTQLDFLMPSCELPLTPFSAKKKNGKKLYELARKGEEINIKKEMITHGYNIISYKFPILKLELDVGSGTYIRSIGHRVGDAFGLGGILTSLRRIKIGEYDITDMDLNKTYNKINYVIVN